MKKQNNWFNNLFFPGAVILYPLLAIFCLFFFFFFFGSGEEFTVLNEKTPNWVSWYIFAILGFFFGAVWGIIKKWWTKRFLAIGTILLFLSFLSLQVRLYHLLKDTATFAIVSAIVSIYCVIKFAKNKFIGKLTWVLPIILIGCHYIIRDIPITLLTSLIALIVISLTETNNKRDIKSVTTVGIVVFYLTSTLTYFPYNPLLSNNNIKAISISYHPRMTSLVVEEDSKFRIVDGISLSGESPIDAKFECWKNISPYNSSFVGFNTDKFNNSGRSNYISQLKSNLYPIVFSDSCVYFTSQVELYKFLEKQVTTKDKRNNLTAKIFFDYINLYNNPDSINLNTLKRHQFDLQSVLESASVDSLVFSKKQANNEQILKDLSRNLSLGMLNAVCSDLVLNNDINSALNIFSFQFFLTFFNTPIYNHINTNFNIALQKTYGSRYHSSSYQITNKELIREDTFEPWVNMASMSIAIAELYVSEANDKSQKEVISRLLELSEKYKPSLSNIYNRDITIEKKKEIEKILESLSNYSDVPTIKNYATAVQKFLYSCVLNDYLPDYNSFFLNRFNEITPMVPMNPESTTAYESFLRLYTNRFEQDIKGIISFQKAANELYSQLDQTILLQDSINNRFSSLKLNLH